MSENNGGVTIETTRDPDYGKQRITITVDMIYTPIEKLSLAEKVLKRCVEDLHSIFEEKNDTA